MIFERLPQRSFLQAATAQPATPPQNPAYNGDGDFASQWLQTANVHLSRDCQSRQCE